MYVGKQPAQSAGVQKSPADAVNGEMTGAMHYRTAGHWHGPELGSTAHRGSDHRQRTLQGPTGRAAEGFGERIHISSLDGLREWAFAHQRCFQYGSRISAWSYLRGLQACRHCQ